MIFFVLFLQFLVLLKLGDIHRDLRGIRNRLAVMR